MSAPRLLTYRGCTRTIAEWCAALPGLGLTPNSLNWRLKNGWSVDRALSEPATRAFRGTDLEPSDVDLIAECIRERERVQRAAANAAAEAERAQREFSISKLAEKFGCTRPTVRRIEAATLKDPPIDHLKVRIDGRVGVASDGPAIYNPLNEGSAENPR